MSNDDAGSLRGALLALENEESAIAAQIDLLQRKLAQVQQARATLSALVSDSTPSLPAHKSYEDMGLAEAINAFLIDVREPKSAGEIAKGLLERGYRTKSEHFANVIGVTLRRLEGDMFKRADNGWVSTSS